MCETAVNIYTSLCPRHHDVGSGTFIWSLCSKHVGVELGDDNGDVIAVHARQLLRQRQHFGQPLMIHRTKLVVSHCVTHQVCRHILVLESRGQTSLPLLQEPLHLSQGDPVAPDFKWLTLMYSGQILPHDTNHFLSMERFPEAIRANHLQSKQVKCKRIRSKIL